LTLPTPRPHVSLLAPYELADTAAPGHSRLIQLAQNENAALPSAAALQAAKAALATANRYPDGDAGPLREAIAAAENLSAARIICGAGSMELLSLIAQAYLAPGDEAVVSQHGYLYFRSVTRLVGATVVMAPERDRRMDIDALLDRVGPRTRVLFLANPNNPTGDLLPRTEVQRLRRELREDVILVLDAAYAEYVTLPDFEPGTELVEATPNTVMTRTFSKIHGLAGLRVGWGYFPKSIADIINRIRHPNAVTGPGIAAAAAAIADRAHMAEVRRSNAARRDGLAQALRAMGLPPYPSHGNFLLIPFASTADAGAADRSLRSRGIILRPMAGYGMGECLRVTIGTSDEMAAVQASLGDWLSQRRSPEVA
jgi:histidinol-phosphate aminotransferase